jgi:Na+-translocating ferredoxin:NAD+ oxidoreductase RNF subunit RnfB
MLYYAKQTQTKKEKKAPDVIDLNSTNAKGDSSLIGRCPELQVHGKPDSMTLNLETVCGFLILHISLLHIEHVGNFNCYF